ncbi:hypothetical protein M5K25_021527 [Dendrobium thyrsiflorum]|uniref:Uncharacterized protein n=1 Tax=Dendrobium thyrsiflorum TaxID=117978 RepID=A0ABD0UCJ8_DENTH
MDSFIHVWVKREGLSNDMGKQQTCSFLAHDLAYQIGIRECVSGPRSGFLVANFCSNLPCRPQKPAVWTKIWVLLADFYSDLPW